MKIVSKALKIFSNPEQAPLEPAYDPVTNTKFIYKYVHIYPVARVMSCCHVNSELYEYSQKKYGLIFVMFTLIKI